MFVAHLKLYLAFLALLPFCLHAQENFLFPVKPGQRAYLAAKMGELRPNHFHSGLDIKTAGVSGWDVYAAADGYIYRMKVGAGGYGRVIYMQHAGGKRTVYAHLESFSPKVEQFLLQEQYKQRTFEIEIYPEPNQFVFKRGEVIAKAGNSGSSTAPHLHFEIRDNEDNLFDPQAYGFSEIKDDVPPIPAKVALVPLDIVSRINGHFQRSISIFSRKGSGYEAGSAFHAYGPVGIEMVGNDKANEVHNVYGIYKVELYVNGKLFYQHQVNGFSFDNSRQINHFVNYDYKSRHRESFQKCYIDDGNILPFYQGSPTPGVLWVQDGKNYNIEMKLFDNFGNSSTAAFYIIGNKSYMPSGKSTLSSPFIYRNVLAFQGVGEGGLTVNGISYAIEPAYRAEGKNVFLWNLLGGCPSVAKVGGTTLSVSIDQVVPSGQVHLFSNRHFDILFPKDALFDTLYLQTASTGLGFEIGKEETALFKSIEVTYRPHTPVPVREKVAVYDMNGRSPMYVGGVWEGEQIRFSTRVLGKFQLYPDEIPPSVALVSASAHQVEFHISDNLAGIKKYEAYLNGQWLLMEYDSKKAKLTSRRLDSSQLLKGTLKLSVSDNCDNVHILTVEI